MPTNPNDPTVLSGMPVARAVTRLGRYTLKQRLGVGGMAEVYLAEQDGPQSFRKKVVVKRILPSLAADPAFVAMFVREAQVAARLSHGNVVQIYELGEHKGEDGTEYFIAMEFIDGLTLQRLATASWNAGRAVPIDVVVRTMADAARGLHAAHTLADDNGKPLKLVHRDISPDNLMVSRDGVTKVLDFGIAKGDLGAPKTRTGNLRGKVPYMSPEQITGQELDGRCDLWALGISTYWLLCGERPFDRANDFHTMQAVLYDQAKPPTKINPAIPLGLEQVITSLLQKDREARPKNASVVADALEELASPGSGAGRRTTVAFVEQHLTENAGAGNPLSESGEHTANTRPLPPPKGGLPSTEVHELPTNERAVTLPAPAVPQNAQRIALADLAPNPVLGADGPSAPRQVTMPDEAKQAPPPVVTATATGAVPAPPPVQPPPTPATAKGPARHPVIDMLAPPKQKSAAPLFIIIGAMLILLGGGSFALWRLFVVAENADAGPKGHHHADAGVAHDGGTPGVAVAHDAGAVVTSADAGAGDAVDAGAGVVDAGVAAGVVDAGFVAPSVVPVGKIAVRASGPGRVVWKLDGGLRVGTGSATILVPAGTTRVIAEDPPRGASYYVTVANGAADFSSLPLAVIDFRQVPGVNIYLYKDIMRSSGPTSVPAGTYTVIISQGARMLANKRITVGPGQTVVVDAAHP